MAGPCKKMRESDEVLYELLQENEHSDISESVYSSDSEMNVKTSSCGEQSISSDEEQNVSDDVACSMAYGQSQVLCNHIFHLLASLA
jgi:hypothetical protein